MQFEWFGSSRDIFAVRNFLKKKNIIQKYKLKTFLGQISPATFVPYRNGVSHESAIFLQTKTTG